jgi:5'-nucleotidase
MNLNQSNEKFQKTLKKTHVLLSNDDGYAATGIVELARALVAEGFRVSVCAPSEERSGQSHAMTFFRPILVKKVSSSEFETFAVHGSPADCVAIALQSIFKNDKPDIVLSGINNGLNVGWDVNYSGTVGAATEAALMGVKAVALSLDVDANHKPSADGYKQAALFVSKNLNTLLKMDWPEMQVLNVNFPMLLKGEKPKGIKHVYSGNYSMYVASVEKLKSEKFENYNVYFIGGHSRRTNGDDLQDVTLVQKGFVTFSFLECRQRSSQIFKQLEQTIENSLNSNLESIFSSQLS